MASGGPPKVDVAVGPADVVVRINDVPHLILRRADLVGVESWVMSQGVRKRFYFIQFTTRSGLITCDYDDRGLWAAILVALGDARPFDAMQGEPAR